MKQHYVDLVKGIDLMSESLISIGKSEGNEPIKILIAGLIGKLGFNNQEVGDDIAMIRFSVKNDDASLEKLTAHMMGGGDVSKAEPKEDPVTKAEPSAEVKLKTP